MTNNTYLFILINNFIDTDKFFYKCVYILTFLNEVFIVL